ncbi:FixH family protein [Aeromonas diversa]|uniref:FixH family protein n=1 Tax=Aeromonas diversa CDC 2478-85 TaxID=1268237 RepID=N9V6Y5_9GAMM|nr:FixH family protein [Aeromonas diversa]ENY71042.1 hypothetical protein G114_15266 [Aeromonas diversa CDC 2478-85]
MSQPWYRQFWPWFLIALPLCAVVASVYTAIIASRGGVNLVAEDYYKQGKEINQDLSKFHRAEALGLTFDLRVEGNTITVRKLTGDILPNQALFLSLFHPTLSGHDSEHLLTADASGTYRLVLDAPITGKWQVRLDAFNHEWRLQETVRLPLPQGQVLDPKGR